MDRYDWENALERVRSGEFKPQEMEDLAEYADASFERQELFEALRHGYAVCYHTARIAKILHDNKK